MIRFSLAVALLISVPAAAQQAKVPTPYDRAIAAGYKAAMLCSGIFNADAMGAKRTRASIEANELRGIYPEFDGLIASLPATIERDRVLVRFDDGLPARVAVSQLFDGCTILPIGTPENTAFGHFAFLNNERARHGWPHDDDGRMVPAKGQLARSIAASFRSEAGTNTTAVVVLRDGHVIGERYAAGFSMLTPQRTWSVAKSISGTIIGAAVKQALVAPAASAPVPEWQSPGDPRASITLDNLMRMASGLHSGAAGNRTDAIYFGGTAVTDEATGWPLEAVPGTRFRYANDDILLAIRALRHVLEKRGPQDEADDFIPNILSRLEMTHTIPETDWRGNYILSSQVWSTARDLARFGMLYLHDGVWDGERILPEGWVKYVTTPSGPQPEGEFGYGATFWLMNKSPGVPADTFAAFGNRGQYVVIVPSRKVVIVRRGEDPAGARFDIAKFTADVLAALK